MKLNKIKKNNNKKKNNKNNLLCNNKKYIQIKINLKNQIMKMFFNMQNN